MNQKGFIKDVAIIAVGILVLGGGYFYFSKKPAYAPAENSNTNQKVADETADWETYKNERYGFEIKYPNEYKAVEDPDGTAIVGFFSNDGSYDTSLKAYLRESKYNNFDDYKNNLIITFVKPDDTVIDGVSHSFYSIFKEENIGGKQVILHRRNFEGMIGNIYEMHVWLDGGKIFVFFSEDDNNVLDKIYHSFKFTK